MNFRIYQDSLPASLLEQREEALGAKMAKLAKKENKARKKAESDKPDLQSHSIARAEANILDFLKTNPNSPAEFVAKALGCSRSYASLRLKELTEKDTVGYVQKSFKTPRLFFIREAEN